MALKIKIGTKHSGSTASHNLEFLYLSNSKDGICNGTPHKISYTNMPVDKKVICALNFENGNIENKIISQYGEGYQNQNLNFDDKFSLYRREIWFDEKAKKFYHQNIWEKVLDISPITKNTYRDFNVANNRIYQYAYFSSSKDKITGTYKDKGELYVPVITNWSGWSITELTPTDDTTTYMASPKDVWLFRYNISSGQQTQNIDKVQQETLSKYPRFSNGVKNAISGSVSCLLGREFIQAESYMEREIYSGSGSNDVFWLYPTFGGYKNLGGYKESLSRNGTRCTHNYRTASSLGFHDLSSNERVDMLNAWKQICYSGNPKLLKDTMGQKFIVQITSPTIETNDSMDTITNTISFTWVEIEDSKKYKIIGIDDINIIDEGEDNHDGIDYNLLENVPSINGQTVINEKYSNDYSLWESPQDVQITDYLISIEDNKRYVLSDQSIVNYIISTTSMPDYSSCSIYIPYFNNQQFGQLSIYGYEELEIGKSYEISVLKTPQDLVGVVSQIGG